MTVLIGRGRTVIYAHVSDAWDMLAGLWTHPNVCDGHYRLWGWEWTGSVILVRGLVVRNGARAFLR